LLGDEYKPSAEQTGEEEEFKGNADFDKVQLDKQFVPSLYEDDNLEFKVAKP
jgi:hypothetical protein